jgi:hypothetical protein
MELNTNVVGPDYFRTMDIPICADARSDLRTGRWSWCRDRERGVCATYLNGEALGKRVRVDSEQPFLEIVGVARTVKYRTLREAALPFIYLPMAQNEQLDMTVIVRAQGDPAAIGQRRAQRDASGEQDGDCVFRGS